MARSRSKVKLAYISSKSARKNCFKKRKTSFVKKMKEITTLCGVEACALIYSDFENMQPTIWPSVEEVRRIIEKFQGMPEFERERRGVNQESFVKQMVMKTEEKLKKLRSENRYKEFTQMLHETAEESFPVVPFMVMVDYVEFDRVVSQHMWEAWSLIENRKKEGGFSANPAPPPPPQPIGDDALNNIPTPDLNFSPFNMDFSMPVIPSPPPFPTDFSPSNEVMPDMGFFPPSNEMMINSPMPDMGSFPPYKTINSPMPNMGSASVSPSNTINPPKPEMGSVPPSDADNSPMPDMGFFPPPA